MWNVLCNKYSLIGLNFAHDFQVFFHILFFTKNTHIELKIDHYFMSYVRSFGKISRSRFNYNLDDFYEVSAALVQR